MTNEISQFFAAFRCFSLIFDEILRISFSLLLISTVLFKWPNVILSESWMESISWGAYVNEPIVS